MPCRVMPLSVCFPGSRNFFLMLPMLLGWNAPIDDPRKGSDSFKFQYPFSKDRNKERHKQSADQVADKRRENDQPELMKKVARVVIYDRASTIPPSIGACSMLDILDIRRVALTKESEVAMFRVRTPARRIEEAIVSVKCISPVRMQTIINTVILLLQIPSVSVNTNRRLRRALVPPL